MALGTSIRLRIIWLIVIASSLVLACKKRQESAVKHDWNSAPAEPIGSIDCSKNQPDEELQEIDQYLQKILARLRQHNPKKFDQVCIFSRRGEGVANAISNLKGIIIYTGLIDVAQDDAEIAATMSHEVAHYIWSHSKSNSTRPKLQGNQEYGSQLDIAKNLLGNILTLQRSLLSKVGKDKVAEPLIKALHDHQNSFDPKLCSFASELVPECEELAKVIRDFIKVERQLQASEKAAGLEPESRWNWQEEDADEFGLEFFARANFSAESFAKSRLKNEEGFRANSAGQDTGGENCWERAKAYIKAGAPDEIPTPRGYKSHPYPCWRVFNVFREMRIHKEDLKPFLTEQGDRFIDSDGSALASAKTKLKEIYQRVRAPNENLEQRLAIDHDVRLSGLLTAGQVHYISFVVPEGRTLAYEIVPSGKHRGDLFVQVFGPDNNNRNVPTWRFDETYALQPGTYLIEIRSSKTFDKDEVYLTLIDLSYSGRR